MQLWCARTLTARTDPWSICKTAGTM